MNSKCISPTVTSQASFGTICSKKGINSVVAIALLLIVSVVSVVSFDSWSKIYLDTVFVGAEQKSSDSADVSGIDKVLYSDLYFVNGFSENITINSISYGGYDCNVSLNATPGINSISIQICYEKLDRDINELVVYTDAAIYSKKIFSKNNIVSTEEVSVTVGSLTTSFVASSNCGVGQDKIIGYVESNNSHLEIASINGYGNSLCLNHTSYTFNADCSGVYDELFWLTNYTDAHLFLDNSSPEPGNYNWTQICVQAVGGATSVDVTYNTSDMSALNYSCIGSYDPTNVNLYGTMYGECSGNLDRIWLKVE